MKLPIKINPFEFCDRGTTLAGKLPISQLSRLSELLLDTAGEVDVQLALGRNPQGRRCIEGRITGTLQIACQRCGNAISYDINLEPRLSPVTDDAKTSDLPAGYEPLLVTDETVLLVDLVSEELLLSLPMIPKHEQGKCPVKLPDYFKSA